MNINNWSDKKKVLALLGLVLIVIGIVVTIFLVQRVQEGRSRASASTTINLAPPTQTIAPGQDATLDVNVDPGDNQVSVVKFTIKFDPEKFSATPESFTLNEALGFTVKSDPLVNNGTFTITVGVGDDTSKVITTPQTLGTFKLSALLDAATGANQITFDDTATVVNSLSGTDSPQDNVLSTANPATITISAECKPNISTCSWDAVSGAKTYHYVITNVDEDKIISEGDTDKTSVEYSSGVDIQYKCEVTAKNECGSTGDAGEDSETCTVPSSTPTPTNGPSSTPTPSPSNTPTPTRGVTSTPTPTTPRITQNSPTPTTPVFATATPTVPQGGISTPTPTTPTSVTATPTLPPTGSPIVIGGIVGGILVLLGGLALLIL